VTDLKLLFDEDVDHRILRGLRRAYPQIDVRAAAEVGLAGRPDRDILAWAATEGRLLVTQDVHTMTAEHSEFLQGGLVPERTESVTGGLPGGRGQEKRARGQGTMAREKGVTR